MSGQIYRSILEKERAGKFLGKTIQMIPHVTDEVKSRIFEAAKQSKCDFLITEIGGTIGDYEGTHFVEAIRQMQHDVGKENVLYVHVGFLPYLGASQELKGRPMQFSVHDLQAMGIQPDILICRSDHPVKKTMLDKIALFTGVDKEAVIPLETVETIYEVPSILQKFNLNKIIAKKMNLRLKKNSANKKWNDFVKKIKKEHKKTVKIGLIGKYMGMRDTYFSVTESLKIAAIQSNVNLELGWIDAEEFESHTSHLAYLNSYDGIIVPGGFGSRGVEGKILAIKYARENKIPFLGLCYGLQLAVIEYSRNICKLKRANTTEIDPKTPNPVINIMPEQEKKMLEHNYGGSMRLGAYPCKLKNNTLSYRSYSSRISHFTSLISERHRHRYEVNNEYREILEKNGLIISGTSPDNLLVEIIELPDHPFFIATQFHPEFLSRPLKPHPLFMEFVKAAKK